MALDIHNYFIGIPPALIELIYWSIHFSYQPCGNVVTYCVLELSSNVQENDIFMF